MQLHKLGTQEKQKNNLNVSGSLLQRFLHPTFFPHRTPPSQHRDNIQTKQINQVEAP
jgi:hypothetical protein